LLRGRDVQELKELQRQGMSIQAISKLTGWDRKTIRKYVRAAGVVPEYGPRPAQPSSRYSVPWQYAGQDVRVQDIAGEVNIRTGRERIAMHGKAQRKHSVLKFAPHHQGIPLGAKSRRQDPDSPAAERAGGGEAFAGGI
jgi:hypothetical protein